MYSLETQLRGCIAVVPSEADLGLKLILSWVEIYISSLLGNIVIVHK